MLSYLYQSETIFACWLNIYNGYSLYHDFSITCFKYFVNISAKDKLYNDFVENEDVCYPALLAPGEMTRQTMTIGDTLWYLDGSNDKINARITDSCKKIPARYIVFDF